MAARLLHQRVMKESSMAGKVAFIGRCYTHHFYLRHLQLFSTTTSELHPPVFPRGRNAGSNCCPSSILIDYLVNSWGFNSEDAETIASRLSTQMTLNKPCSVLNYLRQSGFEDAQIKKLVVWRPKLLVADVDKTLIPKLKVFQDLGFSGNEIVKLIAERPNLLVRSFAQSVDLLRMWFPKKEEIRKVVRRSRFRLWPNFSRAMLLGISILQKHGVHDHFISKMIEMSPSSLLRNPDWLEKHVLKVIDNGFDPNSWLFIHALRVMCSLNESTWKAKVEAFKRFGWSEGDVLHAFRSMPFCLSLSEENIRQKLEFFMNVVKYDSVFLSFNACLLCLSLEKRIIPRYRFCEALNSKKIHRKDIRFSFAVKLNESVFRKRFILPYMDIAPDICEAYMSSVPAVVSSDG